ncbi:MAG: hypothetical protein JSS86_14915, partial [Cyanobacteria bacterium SZAS LIN-2]|nr:hypothetical protein [Cyanobacteria bacterium SZAS LIN-2]
TANTIVINSPSGQFGNVKPLAIKTSDLTVTGAATVIVKNSGSTPLTIGASAASNLNISTNGAIVLGGDISAASVSLKSGAGQGISALLPSYQISAQFMTLTSGTKGIGSAAQALLVDTQVLTINSGSGSAYVSNNNSSILTLAGSNTAGTLKLSTPGSIYVAAIVGKSNSNVDLVSQFGSFLSASTVNDVITGKNVVLAAGNNIGSPGLNDVPLMIKATNLTASAGGLVILSNLSTSPVTLNDSAGSYFVYNGKAATTIHDVATSNGKIAIATSTGLLQTAAGSNITAINGTISLQASSLTSGSILIGKNSTIATSGPGGGDVFITIGNQQIPIVQGTAPANVVTLHPGSGSDYYGKNGITALAPVNTITLKGASVYFNTDTRPASAIKLGGGVNITADPPGPADGIVATDATHALVQAPLLVSAAPAPIKATLAPAVSITTSPVTLKGEIEQTAPAQISAPLNLQSLAQNMSLPAMASLAASVSARQQGQLGWISDTELASGEIPAMMSGACAPLERGSVVFAPTKDIVVQTAYGPLEIAAKSVVLVMSFRHGLAIYNLHDLRANAVCIKVNDSDKKIALIPGRAAVITGTNVRAFEQINPAQLFAYRNLRCRNIGESKQVFLSEFHTLQAISCVQPLKEMLRSKDAGAQKISGQLLKTSAILLQLGGARFEQIPRPHAIALNPSH